MAQYAYVVTGTTASDIQDQIDIAHNTTTHTVTGGTVFLPGGTYTLDLPVELYPNVRLQGVGSRTILKPSGGASLNNRNLIELKGGEDSYLHDMEICDMVLFGPGNGDEITDDVASNSYQGCGIIARGSIAKNIVVNNCRFENLSGCGILVSNDSALPVSNIQIRRCVFFNNRRPSSESTLWAYNDIFLYGNSFEDIVIENNSCTFVKGVGGIITAGSALGNASGIALYNPISGSDGVAKNIIISGNTSSAHYRYGINPNFGRAAIDGGSMNNNSCDNNGSAGILLSVSSTSVADPTVERTSICENYCNYNGF